MSQGRRWNVDFALKELDPSAEWLLAGAARNLRIQAQEGRPGVSAEELRRIKGAGDGYEWNQNEDGELEVTVPLPDGTRGKACNVAFGSTSLKVEVAGTDVCLDLALFAKVRSSGSTWSIDEGELIITLEKLNEGLTWPSLVA